MDSLKVFLVFVVICGASVMGKPFTIDVLENRDIIFPRRSDLVKRTTTNNDVSEFGEQKVSLASFIENIETGLLHTALSVDPLASDPHAEVQDLSTPHPAHKRSTVEDSNNAGPDSSTPVVIVQTTENVPAMDSVPSHVVIDRVSVFKSPDAGLNLFPTFLVQDTNASVEATELTQDSDADEEGSTPASSSDSDESTESSESSQSSKSSSKEKAAQMSSTTSSSIKNETSSTSSPSKSTSSSPSTPKPPVDEKKTVEKELKEKVVEVEADPVIFTARV